MNPRARREPPKKRGRQRARIIWGRFSVPDVAVDYEAVLAAEGLAVIDRPLALPLSHPDIPDDATFPKGQSRRDFVSAERARKIEETEELLGRLTDVLGDHARRDRAFARENGLAHLVPQSDDDLPRPLSQREHLALELWLDGLSTRLIAVRLRAANMRLASNISVERVLQAIARRHGLGRLKLERSK